MEETGVSISGLEDNYVEAIKEDEYKISLLEDIQW